jgi:predicted HD phosphohydrolase
MNSEPTRMTTPLPDALVGTDIETRFNWLKGQFRAAAEADYIGEDVSQLDHSLQCATLAMKQNDDELILASLLHDIGHIVPSNEPSMEQLGTRNHEHVGADALLGLGFSPRVARLVAGHVDAKRYLASTRPGYLQNLSTASSRTLELQGGPMDKNEQQAFEAQTDHSSLVQLRGFDEGAKALGARFEPLSTFFPLIRSHMDAQAAQDITTTLKPALSHAQLDEWKHNQVLVIPAVLEGSALDLLRAWTQDLADRPEQAGRWMKYFERTPDDDRLLCRIENFVPFHAGMDALLRGPEILERVSELMGEQAVLFKEKINFKLPGGSGFAAHQDAPAFDAFGQRYHITVLITVDPSDTSNGGLEFGETTNGHHILEQNPDGTVAHAVEDKMQWTAMDLPAGSIVFFDSYIPHRSPRNESNNPRRSLYITYSRASEGNCRDRYYADKRNTFPPEIEREPGIDYAKKAGRYNLANPIR